MGFDSSRTEKVLGADAVKKLAGSHVAVFGTGGVGGFVCEALVRAGIGKLTIVDGDVIDASNINRQIIALASNTGYPKVLAMKERILSINPDCEVDARQLFFLPENSASIDFGAFDAVADCVDTVAAKVEIAKLCTAAGTDVISSMGAGNKLHPESFRISDIYKTSVDPLAKAMRLRLRNEGIKHLTAVWSDEIPTVKAVPPGSLSFVPSAAGLIMAGWIVRRICGLE